MLAALVSVCLLVAPSAGAKEKKPVTRTITGAVLDQAENGIAGASVELTDLRTGKKVAIYSEQGGRYEFDDLKPEDDYQVQASYKNQPSEVRKVTSLIRDMRVVINLHIPPPTSE
jgi:carboxypeptidase family protein